MPADGLLREGQSYDIRPANAPKATHRLTVVGGVIQAQAFVQRALPPGYQEYTSGPIGRFAPEDPDLISVPYGAIMHHMSSMADILESFGQLNGHSYFMPTIETLRAMIQAVSVEDPPVVMARYVGSNTNLWFEIPLLFDCAAKQWRPAYVPGVPLAIQWNKGIQGITTRVKSTPKGYELIPNSPGHQRLSSFFLEGSLGVPLFYNGTNVSGFSVKARKEEALRGFNLYVATMGTGLLIDDDERYDRLVSFEIVDDMTRRFVLSPVSANKLNDAGESSQISFDVFYDADSGVMEWLGSRVDISFHKSNGLSVTGPFSVLYHLESRSYLLTEALPPAGRTPIVLRVFFLQGSPPLVVDLTRYQGHFPAHKREANMTNESLVEQGWVTGDERLVTKARPGFSRGGLRPRSQSAGKTPAVSNVVFDQTYPTLESDRSPYLAQADEWNRLFTLSTDVLERAMSLSWFDRYALGEAVQAMDSRDVNQVVARVMAFFDARPALRNQLRLRYATATEAIRQRIAVNLWLNHVLEGWFPDIGGDFQLLPESVRVFCEAQARLRETVTRLAGDSVALKEAIAQFSPVTLWFMNTAQTRMQVTLTPYLPPNGSPLWVSHSKASDQKVSTRFVGIDHERPGELMALDFLADYSREGHDQTLTVYNPSLKGGVLQKLKLVAFDGGAKQQSLDEDFLVAFYDSEIRTVPEGEESWLSLSVARRRMTAEHRLQLLHRLVEQTKEEFVRGESDDKHVKRHASQAATDEIILLEKDELGEGRYTGRLLKIRMPQPVLCNDGKIHVNLPPAVRLGILDELTVKKPVWEEDDYHVYQPPMTAPEHESQASHRLFLVHPQNPNKQFELTIEANAELGVMPRLRHIRGFEKGLRGFYAPSKWSMVYPVDRVRAEGTNGIARVEDVSGEYPHLENGHSVQRYYFSVEHGSLKKSTRLDLELDETGHIIRALKDKWDLEDAELDTQIIDTEVVSSDTITRLRARETSRADEFFSLVPLETGGVRVILRHRPAGLGQAVGNSHYLAIDFMPDPETHDFRGQNARISRLSFRHDPRDPSQFFLPNEMAYSFPFVCAARKGAPVHPMGFYRETDLTPENGMNQAKAVALRFYHQKNADSRRDVSFVLQEMSDGKVQIAPGSFQMVNFNTGKTIVENGKASVVVTEEGELKKVVVEHPQVRLQFWLNTDNSFPENLGDRSFLISESSSAEELKQRREARDQEVAKMASVGAIDELYRQFLRGASYRCLEETDKIALTRFQNHPVANTALGLVLKNVIPLLVENNEDASILAFVIERLTSLSQSWADSSKEGTLTPLQEKQMQVVTDYLVTLVLARKQPWMVREWEDLENGLANLLEGALLDSEQRLQAFSGFLHYLWEDSGLNINVIMNKILIVRSLPLFGRERDATMTLLQAGKTGKRPKVVDAWYEFFKINELLQDMSRAQRSKTQAGHVVQNTQHTFLDDAGEGLGSSSLLDAVRGAAESLGMELPLQALIQQSEFLKCYLVNEDDSAFLAGLRAYGYHDLAERFTTSCPLSPQERGVMLASLVAGNTDAFHYFLQQHDITLGDVASRSQATGPVNLVVTGALAQGASVFVTK